MHILNKNLIIESVFIEEKLKLIEIENKKSSIEEKI